MQRKNRAIHLLCIKQVFIEPFWVSRSSSEKKGKGSFILQSNGEEGKVCSSSFDG